MSRLPYVPFLPKIRSNPGLSEIEALLEFLPSASLIVDLATDRILLGNSRATELSAFTRAELRHMDFSSLLSDMEGTPASNLYLNPGEIKSLKLTTRNKQMIEVWAVRQNLSQKGRWCLVTLETVTAANKREVERQRRADLLESMQMISQAVNQTDLDSSLDLFLGATQKMTGAESLSIYLHNLESNGKTFKLSQIASQGVPNYFPSSLPAQEAVHFRIPVYWSHGKRLTTSLHKAAKSAGSGYMAYAPLGQPNAIIGCFVIAGNSSQPEQLVLDQLRILADAITAIIEIHNRFSNINASLRKNNIINAISAKIEDSIEDGLILLDSGLRVSRLNNSATTMLGYSNTEARSHPVEDILIGSESLLPSLSISQQGIPTPNLENIRLYRRSGEAFLARVAVIPTKFDGALQGVIILIRDLSEKEQIETQAQELEQRALLGEVTAIFAHEVRNPINNISTGLQLMAYNLQADDPNQETIVRLQQDCDRLSDLMKSVLAFSRPTEYEMEYVDIGVLITRLIDRLRPRLVSAKVEHRIQVEPNLPAVHGNPRALEQVFSNLFTNAMHAMEEIGGTLAIKIHSNHASTERKYVVVDVADDGPGIPRDIQDRIFQPFFTTKPSGTGLGLAITKRIITAHKGTILLTSFPGGTVFHVNLPVMEF